MEIWSRMVRAQYKVFLGAPTADRVSLNESRDDLSWQVVVSDGSKENSNAQGDDEEMKDLYANTIFGKNNSAYESRSWDLPSSSLLPGLSF
jgi:hypothetical protein